MPTMDGRPGRSSSRCTSKPRSPSQALQKSAIAVSPAPPGTRSGLTELIATRRFRSSIGSLLISRTCHLFRRAADDAMRATDDSIRLARATGDRCRDDRGRVAGGERILKAFVQFFLDFLGIVGTICGRLAWPLGGIARILRILRHDLVPCSSAVILPRDPARRKRKTLARLALCCRVLRRFGQESEDIVGERAPAFDAEGVLAGAQQHDLDLAENGARAGADRKGGKRQILRAAGIDASPPRPGR